MRSGLGGHARVVSTLLVLASVAAAFGGGGISSAAAGAKLPGTNPTIAASCRRAEMRSLLVEAAKYAEDAVKRLDYLGTIWKGARLLEWNALDEGTWFGPYRSSRFSNTRKRMKKIAQILSSPRLKIECDRKTAGFDKAYPAIYKIRFGKWWSDIPRTRVDKTQKIVRAAARIAGATLDVLGRDQYGVPYAVQLTRSRGTMYPGLAIRTADNLGYYAVCRSTKHRRKSNCP